MNTFLRPNVFKIIITILILLVIFGGPLIYPFTEPVTVSGPQQLNLFAKIINVVDDIINYPIGLILRPFSNFTATPTNNINNPYILFITIISLILTIIESYLISCIILAFINKIMIAKKWKERGIKIV